jgi:hypothetical protein
MTLYKIETRRQDMSYSLMSTLDAAFLMALQLRSVFGHALGDILSEGVCFAAVSTLAASRAEALVVTLTAVKVKVVICFCCFLWSSFVYERGNGYV